MILQKVHRTIPAHQSAIDEKQLRFFLPAPYSEERRRAASEAAKKYGVHRKVANLYESIG